MTNRWLILRVFAGLPLQAEKAINECGLAQAYCPVETIERRHHVDRRRIITTHKPLLPGYCFASEHFPVEAINSTRLKARWLQLDGRIAYLTEADVRSLKARESAWRPSLDGLLHALNEISRGVKPHSKYVRFGDWQRGMAA